jgi:nickel/cobalt exporter
MPVTRPPVVRIVTLVLALTALALIAGAIDASFAQGGNPFGAGPPASRPPAPPDGIVGWLLAKQSEFYRALSATVRAAKQDGTAVFGLLGLSFAYGIFHAAGPGHGKAVISSYLVANEETWRRGVVLSFASALLQALVAVVIVGIAAALLGATAKVMGDTVRVIETASYLLIIAVGLRLLWVKGRGFLTALHAVTAGPALVAAGPAALLGEHHHDAHDEHDHAHHAHGHDHDHHDGEACEHCGHAHGPEPGELAGPGGWQRGLSAIVAVGLRPCSGAILVLVFALANGLFWAGVASTFVMGLGTAITVAAIATLAVGARSLASRLANRQSGYGTLALRGIEVAAAVVVVAFGALLLTGYMVSERMFGV